MRIKRQAAPPKVWAIYTHELIIELKILDWMSNWNRWTKLNLANQTHPPPSTPTKRSLAIAHSVSWKRVVGRRWAWETAKAEQQTNAEELETPAPFSWIWAAERMEKPSAPIHPPDNPLTLDASFYLHLANSSPTPPEIIGTRLIRSFRGKTVSVDMGTITSIQ